MRDNGSVVRYLLLPIPRLDLYLAQMVGALADPWILLVIPLVVLGIPIGLAIGLHVTAAVLALAAGLAFLILIAGITSLISSTIHLLLRDRRRWAAICRRSHRGRKVLVSGLSSRTRGLSGKRRLHPC